MREASAKTGSVIGRLELCAGFIGAIVPPRGAHVFAQLFNLGMMGIPVDVVTSRIEADRLAANERIGNAPDRQLCEDFLATLRAGHWKVY